jgi:protein-ribulosamine 3-kinase
MMEGEFNSITTIHNLIPSFVPKPLAWGKFKLASPDTYFFLCDFVEMSTDMPDPVKFCARVAELHDKGVSPTGKFGFHITTVHGKTEQPVEWEGNWTRYFTRLVSHFFAKDLLSNGRWPEYETAFKRLVEDVIPQVLDPLNSDGRSIRPSLVHGDLWEGNATTDLVTGEPMVFDAAVMYAHNEYELGCGEGRSSGSESHISSNILGKCLRASLWSNGTIAMRYTLSSSNSVTVYIGRVYL